MLAEQRAEIILHELTALRTVSVSHLCQLTGASEATIRRDLNTLAHLGKLSKGPWRRHSGGGGGSFWKGAGVQPSAPGRKRPHRPLRRQFDHQ